MMIIGVDPGPKETGYAIMDTSDYLPLEAGKLPNAEFSVMLSMAPAEGLHIACEGIQSQGMPVGKEVFETCFNIGEYRHIARVAAIPFFIYPRQEYARSICGCKQYGDAVLRKALIMRFGGDRKGEPLNLLKGDTDRRSAFAVAVYHADLLRAKVVNL